MAADAEAAAARTLCGCARPLLVLILLLPELSAESLSVEMAGKTQTVLLHHDATISCLVHGASHLHIEKMGVIWFWKNQANGKFVTVFEFFGEHQKAFRSGAHVSLQGLAKGNASLQLSGVQLREAGEYRCKVVNTPDEGQGTVILEVIARPVSSLSMEEAKVKDNDGLHLQCKANGFYPKGINITWCKWNQENSQCLKISENVTTNAAIENEDNTFNITSILRLKHSPEHNETYRCMVEHVSLPTPWQYNITVPQNGSQTKSHLRNHYRSIVLYLAGLVLLMVPISIWMRSMQLRCNMMMQLREREVRYLTKIDSNKDRLVTLQEFLKATEKKEFLEPDSWETLDQQQFFTEEELKEYENLISFQENELKKRADELQKQKEELQRQHDQLEAQKLEYHQVVQQMEQKKLQQEISPSGPGGHSQFEPRWLR